MILYIEIKLNNKWARTRSFSFFLDGGLDKWAWYKISPIIINRWSGINGWEVLFIPDHPFIIIKKVVVNCHKTLFLYLKSVGSSENVELYSRQRTFNPEKQYAFLKTGFIFWKSLEK